MTTVNELAEKEFPHIEPRNPGQVYVTLACRRAFIQGHAAGYEEAKEEMRQHQERMAEIARNLTREEAQDG